MRELAAGEERIRGVRRGRKRYRGLGGEAGSGGCRLYGSEMRRTHLAKPSPGWAVGGRKAGRPQAQQWAP